MLKIADKFTNGMAGFRLYVTDLSLYNIAIGADGILKIVDGENIVVVDLEKIEHGRFLEYLVKKKDGTKV